MTTTMKTLKLLVALLIPIAQTGSAFIPSPQSSQPYVGTTKLCRKRSSPPPTRRMASDGDGSGRGFGGSSPEEDMTPPSAVSRPTTATSSSAPLGGGEFEMQEMKFQLRGMLKRGIPSRALLPEKRDELASYVRATAMRVPSPVPPGKLAEPGRLNGTWKLAFSTEAATLGDLPREANVVVTFKDDRKVDYELQFTEKVWGLEGITAESDYMVDVSFTVPLD
uniref:Plastid lipid-associated protein/fibrillin conserved domain-containing protein n=1 Tax=Odontella aurita TaxID=265563 RepID=A0A7S4N287_9STRA|mmetsp:Transcript_45022/g.137508  ORF Transcript_45022/g.137508 Transcript_45022/m.137508 type:complete len:222 (+) Transcript_45022:337-1002(+)